VGEPSDGKAGTEQLKDLLPLQMKLPKSSSSSAGVVVVDSDSVDDDTVVGERLWRLVEVDTFQTKQEVDAGRKLMNDVILDGKTWPFESTFETDESYRGYFLSHAAFVVRSLDDTDRNIVEASVLGCFYIKPNFPGRCSHICNGGFIVNPTLRGNRVGTLMGASFLRLAKELGYKGAYFNLVFESNDTSVRLWERLGFDKVAVIPNAARLVGMPIDPTSGEAKLDTAFGYYYNLKKLPSDYDPISATNFAIQSTRPIKKE
jgi:GNAT superfamily N-acetyltransferase